LSQIPELNYCPRCGHALQNQEASGRVRRVCSACGRVAYRQLKVGAGALLEEDGCLLLVQRSLDAFPGAWCLPAGYCECDEPPEVTAARETREETGLEIAVGDLFGAFFFDDDPRGNGILLVYRAQVVGGALRLEESEVSEARAFAPDALPRDLAGGGHDQAIAMWHAQRANL
jgi:ADP-ribose pyrophosphatase YjhB (NUDIX family)